MYEYYYSVNAECLWNKSTIYISYEFRDISGSPFVPYDIIKTFYFPASTLISYCTITVYKYTRGRKNIADTISYIIPKPRTDHYNDNRIGLKVRIKKEHILNSSPS